jgi:hypothetical protein
MAHRMLTEIAASHHGPQEEPHGHRGGKGMTVAVQLNHNEPAFYCMPAKH